MTMRFVVLNGRATDARVATTSVFDRGLLYGEGTFTTLKVRLGHPLFWGSHADRLRAALTELEFPEAAREWDYARDVRLLVRKNRIVDAAVRITVTRGPADGLGPKTRGGPTVIVFARPLPPTRRFLDAITVPEMRDGLRHLKTINRLPGALARSAAERAGVDEAIFVARGALVEGAAHNVFAIVKGRLVTPSIDRVGLAGVVRRVLVERLGARVGSISRTTDGPLFLTNSLTGAAAVRMLDGRELARDPAFEARLRRALRDAEDQEIR